MRLLAFLSFWKTVMQKQMTTVRDRATGRQTAGDPPSLMWWRMLLPFTLPLSLAFGISSRPREQAGMLRVDTHAFECGFFHEGTHELIDD